jgi:hypothetical protein
VRDYAVEGKGKTNLMAETWDYLIILDACRYDYFQKVYGNYLRGTLRKARSPASATSEWLKKTFTRRYNDVIYVSANPYINSRGVDVVGFDARDHFHKIVDVWDFGWDETVGTVPPEEVNEAAITATLTHPDKRLIIHYLQPHAPYISIANHAPESVLSPDKLRSGVFLLRNPVIRYFWKILSGESRFLKDALINRVVWKIGRLFGPLPSLPMDDALRLVGQKGLLRAYESNVRLVLKHVAKLMDRLQGKIVVTSDHGELLGEKNEYYHRPQHYISHLIDVPYLEC